LEIAVPQNLLFDHLSLFMKRLVKVIIIEIHFLAEKDNCDLLELLEPFSGLLKFLTILSAFFEMQIYRERRTPSKIRLTIKSYIVKAIRIVDEKL
jgi:hypothetical protein